jgi:hypothetical protein
MSLAHVHLLLNHFPTIGFVIALALFLIALFSKSSDLKRMSLVVFFLIGVVGIPTYLSGNAAERELCPESECAPGVSVASIRNHEDAALMAFTFMGITGFFAWLGLWQLRRVPSLPAWNVAAVLLPALLTVGLMAAAANVGSQIRHPELRSGEAGAEDNTQAPKTIARSIGDLVSGATGQGWVFPACETTHFVGLSLLFTVVLLVDLRILGVAKSVSFAAFYQLLPLGMLGFTLNLITGMLFFIGVPGQYVNNNQFHWKIVFVVLAGINALYFMLFDEVWNVRSGDSAPLRAKIAALSAIVLLVGVLFFGHMLPFLGTSF